jgi:phage terminase large subunit-like protein
MLRTARAELQIGRQQLAFIQGQAPYELFLGGIGAGKSFAGAIKALEHIRPGTLGMVTAPSFRMLRDATWRTCLEVWRDRLNLVTAVLRGDELRMELATGAEVIFRSAEDPEHLRGPNLSWFWVDEGALCKEEVWPILIGRLRQHGRAGRGWVTTTPKGANWVHKVFVDQATEETALYRASTAANPFLPSSFVQSLESQYTRRLARQELEAEFLTDVPGALWTGAMFEPRLPVQDLRRTVVAIDPAVTSGEASDETGIVVAGVGVDGRGYVLADRSCRLSPDGWARRAVAAYHEFSADRIVAEANNGGEMVALTLRTVDPVLPVKIVHASKAKRARAEPVAALYEQGRVSHVPGDFDALIDQCTTWTPESGQSPDRLDALVWALTELMLTETVAHVY